MSSCKWWQPHDWGKWEKYGTKTLTYDNKYKEKREILKRTCKRCGLVQAREVVIW